LPTFFLNKKRLENKKTLKTLKNVTKIKNVKRFLHLWLFRTSEATKREKALETPFTGYRPRSCASADGPRDAACQSKSRQL